MIFYYCSYEYPEFDTVCDAKAMDSICVTPRSEDIFVLFEQPMPDEEALLSSSGCTVFAHGGIRLHCEKFSTPPELGELLETEHRRRRHSAGEAYLAQLPPLAEEEAQYLRDTYAVEPPVPRTEAPQAISPFAGKLVTYRGSDEGFAQILRQLDKKFKKRRLLYVDADLFRPSFDALFAVRRLVTAEHTHLTGRDNTGLNVALEMLSRKTPLDEIIKCTVKKRSRTASYMLGNYNIFNIEHYSIDRLLTLISGMQQRYDVVIAKLSGFVFDEFSMALTHRANLNIVAVDGDRSSIRFAHQLYEVLTERQDIDPQRLHIYRTGLLQNAFLFSALFRSSHKGMLRAAFEKSFRRLAA